MKVLALTSIVLAALGACAAAPEGGGSPKAGTADAAAFAGRSWVGTSAPGVDPGQAPRLELLRDGRVAGYTGCNVLGGQWRVEDGALRFSNLAATKRACIGPQAEVERRFLAAVNEKSRVSLEGGRLVVQSGTERVELSEGKPAG